MILNREEWRAFIGVVRTSDSLVSSHFALSAHSLPRTLSLPSPFTVLLLPAPRITINLWRSVAGRSQSFHPVSTVDRISGVNSARALKCNKLIYSINWRLISPPAMTPVCIRENLTSNIHWIILESEKLLDHMLQMPKSVKFSNN